MTKTRKTRIHLTAGLIGAAALLIPLSMSPADPEPVTVTDACAEETCCREIGSFCEKEDERVANHYKTTVGCEEIQ